jgi:signal transduction histidine kinase
MRLRVAEHTLVTPDGDVARVLDDAVGELAASVADLRALARGLQPAGLADEGLAAALAELARRTPVAVSVDLDGVGTSQQLPAGVEAAAYFVVSETLANAAKHSSAKAIDVVLRRYNDRLLIIVKDDGVGGARLTPGGGLVGLAERIDTHAGRLHLHSAPGRGTTITAELPCVL